MSRDSQRYRKTYSYYRVQPKTELLEVIVDETLDWKNSVRAASTGTVSLTGVGTTLSFGGITIVDEDRVLLKDQSISSQNGIYYFEVSGGNYALTRASDARQGTLSSGATVYVEEGTNAGKIYILSTTGTITVDTTSLTWTEFTGGGGSGSPGGSDTYVQFNDGGSFGGVSSLTFNKTTGALTGTYVLATTGFSGSLTKLTDGTPYILAGPNITINTGSNGAVQITGSAGGVTGTGTDGYLPVWTSSTSLGNGPIRFLTSDILAYDRKYHWFRDDGSAYVYINSNSTTGGRVGINTDPEYPLHITQTSNPVSILEFARFRNTNAGAGSGVQQTYLAGNFSNPTFRITHTWPSNEQGHYTYFGIAKPTPSGTTTPEIVERVRLFSSGAIELSGSVTVRQDSEIASNKTVFEVQKSNGNQILWVSSSAGTNSVGSDVFMWVSGSRTDNNSGADKVVFGGDVRISGSLAVGTGSVFITSNDIQFGTSTMRIQKNGNDMKFFDISNPSGLTLSELASGGGGGSSPEYWVSPSSGVIYATGSVGIGTSSISSRLHVSGSGTGTTTTLTVRHGVANGSSLPVLNVQNSSGDSLLYVSGSGFVGIGTTTQSALADLAIGTGATIVSVASSGVGSFPGAGILFEVNNTLSGTILVSDAGMTVGGGAGRELLLISDNDTKVAVTPGGLVRIIDNDSYFDADVNSGQGIKLASSPGNAGAQVLDAYYEADLSAVIDCSGNDDNGVYVLDVAYDTLKMTRVGRLVTIGGDLRIDSLGDTPSGRLYILLGTTSGQYPSMDTAASVYVTGAIDLSDAIASSIQAYVEASTNRMYIDGYLDGSKVDIAAQVGAGVTIKISVTYAV